MSTADTIRQAMADAIAARTSAELVAMLELAVADEDPNARRVAAMVTDELMQRHPVVRGVLDVWETDTETEMTQTQVVIATLTEIGAI